MLLLPMKIDPRHLEILAAIVDCGGLSEGAASIGKSQPSVSRSLGILEERLGTKLFAAGKRPLQPTELCLALAQHGRAVRTANQAAGETVAQFKTGRSGAVRVAGTPIFMDGVVSPMLAGFQAKFPAIRIDTSYGYVDDILAQLEQGAQDLGIVPITEARLPPGMMVQRILPGRNVIACRVGHPLTRGTSLRVADIAKFPWVAPPPTSPLYQDLRDALQRIGMSDFKVSFSGGTLSSVANVIQESDALTVLPYSVVFNMRRRRQLEALSIRIGDPDRHLYLIGPRKGQSPPPVERLFKYVKREFDVFSDLVVRKERELLWQG